MSNIVIWRFPKRGYPQIIQVIGPWLCIETTMVTTRDPHDNQETPMVKFTSRPETSCPSSFIREEQDLNGAAEAVP